MPWMKWHLVSISDIMLTQLKESLDQPDRKVHGANMGPTWVLSATDGPHVGPTNLAFWVSYCLRLDHEITFCAVYVFIIIL